MDVREVDVRLAVSDRFFGNAAVMIRCREPPHRDTEQSMAVYRSYIRCYGCGKVIQRRMEALAYLLYGDETRWSDARKEAGKYIGREMQEKRVDTNKNPLPRNLAELHHHNLITGSRQNRLGWLLERGLTTETMQRFLLGHDGLRFTIPVFDQRGELLTFRYRRDDRYEWEDQPTPKYSGMVGRNGLMLYPVWLIEERKPELLYVWEGEFDTVFSWQINRPAATVTNGAGNLSRLPGMIRELFSFVRTLVIGGDMDEPGRKAAEQTADEARRLDFTVRVVRWDISEGKDLTEYARNRKRGTVRESLSA